MIRLALASVVVVGFAASAFGTASAAEGGPGPACIQSEAVRGAEVLDNRTLLFHMADGDVLLNHLREPCAGLPGREGFYHGIRADAQICADHDVVRIRETSVCRLGSFAEYGHDNVATDLRDPAQR